MPDLSILSLLLLGTESGPFQRSVCSYAVERIADRCSESQFECRTWHF
jgi:hypothetical protein